MSIAAASIGALAGCVPTVEARAVGEQVGDAAPVATTLSASLPATEKTALADSAARKKDSACVDGMVEVEGDYCPSVEQTCLRYVATDKTFPRRCAEFAKTGACRTKTVKKHFCVDRFEFPNEEGKAPVVMKSGYQAKASCEARGRRLCGDSEWTLACEGSERLPYPYGFTRSAEACNIDKPHPAVNERALANPATRDGEAARLWQGEASGSRSACVSPFGVMDMTGNVDEWVVNESGKPYQSGLKGGYWGPVRDRCRPMTKVHNEEFSYYQVGFRCCADAR